ncbi:exo-beta-N-acetylmuramidase NamZ family protein [Geofilum sp. OHC36d9]|uniref:exo-beta-N-acetylmuramidase NamZ family protein n=1 Tax=Geofilum sp. OHC36d9 TaxID=3458413 RepID=UPI004033ED96
MKNSITLLFCFLMITACTNAGKASDDATMIRTGAEQMDQWLPLLKGRKIALLVNHTSLVDGVHLLDTLVKREVDIDRVFVPEHGFRGDADAGEHIEDSKDAQTGLPIISLYGSNKKPTEEQLEGLDIVIFDIQDVGVRFYTYISTLHYMMEACAENNVAMIVLDRPNPNGDYIDGPVLQKGFESFIGMHPIPLVHGLTVGELAEMINGEGWLKDGIKCSLSVIPVKNYTKDLVYEIPVAPSPNLPNYLSVRLYPSLCLFEATEVSIGRGTLFPFQVIGYPDTTFGDFSFTPVSIKGMAKSPLQEGNICYGEDLRNLNAGQQRFSLSYFIKYYQLSGYDKNFISRKRWFNLLVGNDLLIRQIEEGMSEQSIRASWKKELETYDEMRQKYLKY